MSSRPNDAGARGLRPGAPDGLPRRRIRIGGLGVETVDCGDGPPVVFVHGNPSWSYGFRTQLAALSRSYRVLAPDLLGFGGSEAPVGGAGFVEQADMLEALLAALDLGRLRLVLHDWGGPIGLRWGVRHPELVGQLVLVNTTASPTFRPPFYWTPFVAPRLGELLVLRWNAFVELLPLMLRAARDPALRARYRDAFPDPLARRAILRLERLEGFAEVIREVESRRDLLRSPCLILWGEPDWYFQRKGRDDLRRRFPRATFVPLPSAGHFPFEDTPETVTDALTCFFRGESLSCPAPGEHRNGGTP